MTGLHDYTMRVLGKKKKLLASVLFEGLRQCQRNYHPGNLFTSPIAIPSWPVYRAVDGQEEKKGKKKILPVQWRNVSVTLDDLPPPSSASRKESQEKERSIYISLTSNTCAVHKYKGLMGRPVGMPCSSLLAALRIGEEWCINKSSLLSGVGGGIGRVACVGYFSLPPLKIYLKKKRQLG